MLRKGKLDKIPEKSGLTAKILSTIASKLLLSNEFNGSSRLSILLRSTHLEMTCDGLEGWSPSRSSTSA